MHYLDEILGQEKSLGTEGSFLLPYSFEIWCSSNRGCIMIDAHGISSVPNVGLRIGLFGWDFVHRPVGEQRQLSL